MPRPTTKTEAVSTLEFFDAKLARILKYRVWRAWKQSRTPRKLKTLAAFQKRLKRTLPTDEEFDATILHLRFFITKSENISHQALPYVYSLLDLPAEITATCNLRLQEWKTWRDSPSQFLDGKTNADFIEIVFYGERAHRNNPNTFQIYDEYVKRAISKLITRAQLQLVLVHFVTCLIRVHVAHMDVFEFLSKCTEIPPKNLRGNLTTSVLAPRRSKNNRSPQGTNQNGPQ